MWSLSGTTRLGKGARTLGYILHETRSGWAFIFKKWGQTLGQFSEPEQVQSEADGTGVKVRNSEGTCNPTELASHDVTPIPSVPTSEHQFMAMPRI